MALYWLVTLALIAITTTVAVMAAGVRSRYRVLYGNSHHSRVQEDIAQTAQAIRRQERAIQDELEILRRGGRS